MGSIYPRALTPVIETGLTAWALSDGKGGVVGRKDGMKSEQIS